MKTCIHNDKLVVISYVLHVLASTIQLGARAILFKLLLYFLCDLLTLWSPWWKMTSFSPIDFNPWTTYEPRKRECLRRREQLMSFIKNKNKK